MNAILSEAARLYSEGYSQREIAAKLNISHKKVLQILVTAGAIETTESRMFSSGMTVEQIAAALGKEKKTVQGRIPYQKGMYDQPEPTKNALRIRACRGKE